MNYSPLNLIRILEDHGYLNKRSTGSHYVFYNEVLKKTVIVPVHKGRDLKKGTFLAILNQAGVDKRKI